LPNKVRRIYPERCASCLGTSYFGIKRYFLILSCLFLNIANAIDFATLDVGKISANSWKLEGVKLSLGNPNNKPSQVLLSATKLTFAKPFNDLTLADIRCDDLIWNQNDIDCRQGRASVKSSYWQSPSTDFTFYFGPKVYLVPTLTRGNAY